MSISFEVSHSDIAGRTGKLHVNSKTVKTPVLFPVINPHIQLVTPREMQQMGVEALITNAYIFYTSNEFREKALLDGLHNVLQFDGVIMTDSGAFQQSVYGDVAITNEQIVLFQQAMGSDIIVPLDIATPPDATYSEALADCAITRQRILEASSLIGEGHLAGPVQGGIFPELREQAGREIRELGCVFTPVGAVVPLMESYRYRDLVRVVMAAKRGLTPASCVHLFGAGHPAMFALATAMGCDVFDSAAYALYARDGRYLTPSGSMKVDGLVELPCACAICRSHSIREIQASEEREKLLALHNLYVTLAEIARIRQAIQDGILWELVDERCRSHPNLLDGYRVFLNYAGELERHDSVSKRRFFYRGPESCRRTEVIRYHNMLHRLPLGRRVLITFTGSVDGNFDDVLFFKPPFGPYCRELAETFPIGQSEVPEWDEDMVRSGVLGIRMLIEAHPDREYQIIADDRWRLVVREVLTGLEDAYEFV